MSPTLILLRKELTDILRDRRTLVMMVVVPVLLYPLLLLSLGGVMLAGKERLARKELTVAVVGSDAEQFLHRAVAPPHTTFIPLSLEASQRGLKTEGKPERIHAAVELKAGSLERLARNEQAAGTIYFTKRSDDSIEAKERVVRLFDDRNVQLLSARLEALKLPAKFAEPVLWGEEDVDFKSDMGPLIASRLLPLVFIVMLFMGAFYAAVDATAGEKERGTLETLLAAPVTPAQVMLAKFYAVVAVASAVTLANVGAMAVTFKFGLSLDEGTRVTLSLSLTQFAMLGAALVSSTLLVSALSITVASLAKTFREGQSYLSPLIFLGMMPGYLAMAPGVELNAVTSVIPLLNVALLIKAVVLGNAHGWQLACVCGSVLACSALAIWVAGNAFASEALRFGGREGWRELFSRRKWGR